jgi:hypothetical protein
VAKNPPTGDNRRIGAVRDRSQVKMPNGHYVKRDADTGRFMDVSPSRAFVRRNRSTALGTGGHISSRPLLLRKPQGAHPNPRFVRLRGQSGLINDRLGHDQATSSLPEPKVALSR